MSQKAITINTPESASAHITADDDAYILYALAGCRSGILSGLECTKVSDNELSLASGGVSNRGYVLRIEGGDSESISIPTGTAGVGRIDIVAARFTRGASGNADSHEIVLITGEAAENPVPPALTQSDIDAGGSVNELALYHVRIDGITISSITRVAEYIGAPRITVSETAPANPREGDLWFW